MSYLPIPPRVWSRVQNPCTFIVTGSTYQEAFIPLTGQTLSQAQANYQDKQIYKGNILQYKGNSSRLTKSQKYSQLAKGFGPNRKKVFATQSQTYTNPNTSSLLRVNYNTIPFPNEITGSPNNISGPYQYGIPNPDGCSTTSLQDGGTLVCGTLANPCTGEIIKGGATSSTICNPASASDVPGASLLCWNNKVQTWFPKPRYTMNNSTSKWPQGYKGFVSAVDPSTYTSCLSKSSNQTDDNSTPPASSGILDVLRSNLDGIDQNSLPPSIGLDVEDLCSDTITTTSTMCKDNTTTTTTTTTFSTKYIPITTYYSVPEIGYIELPVKRPKYGIFKICNQTGEFMTIKSTYIMYNISYAIEGRYEITNYPPNTSASFTYLKNSSGKTIIQVNIF